MEETFCPAPPVLLAPGTALRPLCSRFAKRKDHIKCHECFSFETNHFKAEGYLAIPGHFCLFSLEFLFLFSVNALFTNTLAALSLMTRALNYVLR